MPSVSRFPWRLIYIFGIIFYFSGCATTETARLPKEEIRLKELCELNGVEWRWDTVSQVVILSRGGLKAKALMGSNTVVIGEEKIILSAPLKRRKGAVIVPGDFKRKVIERLAPATDFTYRRFQKIVLDAGHGGKDPGAIGRSGTKEKNVVLDIAKRLKRKLEEKNFVVFMTRNSDKFISLEERTHMASRAKGDLFVSIHANANRSRSLSGTEVYYPRESAQALKANDNYEKNCKIYFNQIAINQNAPVVSEILIDMLSYNKPYESQKFAQHLSQNTLNDGETKSRGSKMAGFYVIKNSLMPAVLIEVGYLTNKNEESLLKTNAYRQKIAELLARGLVGYLEQ